MSRRTHDEPSATARSRITSLALLARFTDELIWGTAQTLLPTLRSSLDLTLLDVGSLQQVTDTVSAGADPVTAGLIDVRSRRVLMTAGAAGMAIAGLLLTTADGRAWLLVAFGVLGLCSGALTNTADVILIESHPDEVDAAATRQTTWDTVGALLGPVLVTLTLAAGLTWRSPLAIVGLGTVAYAVTLARTRLPAPPHSDGGGRDVLRQLVTNATAVLRDGAARRWLGVHLCIQLLDVAAAFQTVWLASVAGLSQQLVAVFVALDMLSSLVGLVATRRLLPRVGGDRLLRWSAAATIPAYLAWLLVPGVAAKLLLAIPRGLAFAPVWPVAQAQALSSVPGRAGAVSAVRSLSGLLPLPLAAGWVSQTIGLTATLGTLACGSMLGVLALTWLPGRRDRPERPPAVTAGGGRGPARRGPPATVPVSGPASPRWTPDPRADL